MRKVIILTNTLIVIFLFGCISDDKIKISQAFNMTSYNMSNKFLELTVIPKSNGRISSLKYNNIELFLPYKEKQVLEDPLLPKIVFSNRSGWKEWLWGKNPLPNSSFTASASKQTNRIVLDMKNKYFMSQGFDVCRKIILEKNTSAVSINTSLKNVNTKKETAALWINAIPNPLSGRYKMVYPARGKVKHIGRRSVKYFKEDTLLIMQDQLSKSLFIAPCQPWVARIYPQQKLALVFITDIQNLLPNGLFYSWQGIKERTKINTMEMIYSPTSLKPGEIKNTRSRILVFKGVSEISTICDNIAINSKVNVDKKVTNIKLILNSVKSYSKLKIQVFLTRKDTSAKLMQKTFIIANLVPGKSSEINYILPAGIAKGKFNISGIINNKTFRIIKPIDIL